MVEGLTVAYVRQRDTCESELGLEEGEKMVMGEPSIPVFPVPDTYPR
jgi:hypothetical protein